MRTQAYPRPGHTGGHLIRDVVGFLRAEGCKLPIPSHILIATSGGIDSLALSHLLIKYGRRVGDPKRMRLVHINHGWRGKHSDDDAKFVKAFGRTMKVPVTVVKIKPPGDIPGESWENQARRQRKDVFSKLARKYRAVILTAHQADDLAETLLWRLFTGSANTHGGGIAARHGVELRPFIKTRKRELQKYLEEEGQTWREDSTNHEERFLRSRMRKELMSSIEKLFPRAIERLVSTALQAQKRSKPGKKAPGEAIGPEILFTAAGLSARRSHWDALKEKTSRPNWAGELSLPDGWKLSRLRGKGSNTERWVLERQRPRENKSLKDQRN
jgi:tRNA(Ile)-lysidine synthetase-like protein